MTADPPLLEGALHDTVACVSPATATTLCGADGSVAVLAELPSETTASESPISPTLAPIETIPPEPS